MTIPNRPILDPIPTTRPHDYSLRAIRKAQEVKPGAVTLLAFPEEWHNPNQKYLAHREQKNGGTCTGQSGAYGARHNYIKLTGDKPTAEEMAQIKRDVRDSLGSLVDILPAKEFSSECLYQMGRAAGNITYPSGGDIRFVAKAMRDYGVCLESQWHSDKERLKVWMYPPGARKTPDGGATPEEAAEFAAGHRISGWAMVGRADGFATFDEVRAAIYKYGWVKCAIPIYTNFAEMWGQEVPVYPFPNGELDGFHAQIVDGYTASELDIEHSWFGWCGQHGILPKEYYTYARDQCVWLVYIDDEEALIGKEIHKLLTITTNIPAMITVDGTKIGNSPQKIAREIGKQYTVCAEADGYEKQCQVVDESTAPELAFVLEPLPPIPPIKKGIFETLIEFLAGIILDLIDIFRRR